MFLKENCMLNFGEIISLVDLMLPCSPVIESIEPIRNLPLTQLLVGTQGWQYCTMNNICSGHGGGFSITQLINRTSNLIRLGPAYGSRAATLETLSLRQCVRAPVHNTCVNASMRQSLRPEYPFIHAFILAEHWARTSAHSC